MTDVEAFSPLGILSSNDTSRYRNTDLDTFSPNGGLLGATSSRHEQDNAPLSGSPREDTLQLQRTGGLLGHTRENELMARSTAELVTSTRVRYEFTSTGLLGSSGTSSMILSRTTKDDASDASQSRTQERSSRFGIAVEEFTENGLLGTSLLSEVSVLDSQEESLPDISDLLKGYERPSAESSPSRTGVELPPLSATSYNGHSYTLRRRSRRLKTFPAIDMRITSSLLETPVHRLKDRLSIATAERLAAGETSTSLLDATQGKIETELWVDRYRPKRFTDLLGDERVHREALGWLKEWDQCVFGKRKPLAKKKSVLTDENEFQYEDAYHRPREKILLLSGPAGFGKTTLGHVAARQAGYEVLEINASDARSGQAIDDRIQPALESGSMIGSKKPVCVIIDEIDGATGGGDNVSSFVNKLISLTFVKSTKKKGRAGGKQDGDGKRPLLRPLICICNDLYASSLTKLRQHSRIIRFNRPADIYLTKRLKAICNDEGLKVDSRALTTLVGIAKGDMRGCLNTLQFVKARNQDVTETVIRSATTGMKEGETSFNTVLGSLFAPIPRKRAKELGLSEDDERRYVGRLSGDLDASGSHDRIAMGCFEHYTNLRQHDPTLDYHAKAAEWLLSFDLFSGTMRSEREYALLPYLSYTLVPIYHFFHERGGVKVERPHLDYEYHLKTRTSEEIYKSLLKCIQSAAGPTSAGLRHLLSNQIVQLEFAPYINRIIAPPLRPVNSQVTKPQERALLARLVEIMVSLELRFIQDKSEDGQLVYRLDPPVDYFVIYDDKRAGDIAVPRYAVRQLVASEIDAKLIARQAEAVERGKTRTMNMFRGSRKQAEEVDEDQPVVDGADNADVEKTSRLTRTVTESALAKKRKADQLDPADKPPVDFFGRPITAPAKKQATGAGCPSLAKPYKVSYRYNEGNSAAVRKLVKVSSFL